MNLGSPVDDREVATIASAAYGLDVRAVTPLTGGLNNPAFRVQGTEGVNVVLTLITKRADRAESIARLQHHLANSGCPVPRPVLSVRGSYATPHRLGAVVVADYVAGTVPEDVPIERLAEIGSLLAKLHRTREPPDMPPFERFLDQIEGWPLSEIPEAAWVWVETKRAQLKSLRSMDLPAGLTHRDLFPSNIVLRTADVVLLDWEGSADDLLVLDIGIAILGIAGVSGALPPERVDTLLRGYQSVRRLTPVERLALPLAIAAAATRICLRRWSGGVDEPIPGEPPRGIAELADAVLRESG